MLEQQKKLQTEKEEMEKRKENTTLSTTQNIEQIQTKEREDKNVTLSKSDFPQAPAKPVLQASPRSDHSVTSRERQQIADNKKGKGGLGTIEPLEP